MTATYEQASPVEFNAFPASAPGCVLVVDDSRVMRGVICRGLALAGLQPTQILQAADGCEALNVLEGVRPGLIISDVNMPNMGGEALLKTLKGSPDTSGIPVVMITSVSSSKRLLELVRSGASRVIRKPFDPLELPNILKEWLVVEALEEEPVLEEELSSEDAEDAPFDWNPLLDHALITTLARMAFASLEPVEEPASPKRLYAATRIPFEGTGTGWIVLSAPLETAAMLGQGMLGEPIINDEATCFDTLAEIANVFIGELLLEVVESLGEPDRPFDFGLPEVAALLPGEPPGPGARGYAIDDGPHRIYVEVTA